MIMFLQIKGLDRKGWVVLLYSPHGIGKSHLAHNPYHCYRHPFGIRNKIFWIWFKLATSSANSLLEVVIKYYMPTFFFTTK